MHSGGGGHIKGIILTYLETRGVAAGVGAEVTLVGLLPAMNSAVPGDLLLIPGAVLAVRTLVDPRGPVALDMVVVHQLMSAGKGAERAVQGTFFRLYARQRRGLVHLRVMVDQLLAVLGGKLALLTAVGKVRSPVFLQVLAAGERLLANGALQLKVLLLNVTSKRGLTVTGEAAPRTFVGLLLLVLPQAVLFQRRLGTKTRLAHAARENQFAAMAAAEVASDVVLTVAAIIAQVAEVRGFLLVDSAPMQAQFRVGAKSAIADVAGDAADPGVERFVSFQSVTASGAEVAVLAAVRFDALVADAHVLL